ncbi:hypothetical protein MKW94_008035 [Papaver nudicaule]|uniref:Uncharacterized protein n=1 Tax=Papaver nudicaule TaxID=74823 RepID=A0AA41VVM3_PAPNU|nr:hypothetical protein [Papaver nudicaule]
MIINSLVKALLVVFKLKSLESMTHPPTNTTMILVLKLRTSYSRPSENLGWSHYELWSTSWIPPDAPSIILGVAFINAGLAYAFHELEMNFFCLLIMYTHTLIR